MATRTQTRTNQATGPLRGLGVVRLSHLTDETLSPEVQRQRITDTVSGRGDDLVAMAEDLDVSGAVSAWNRDLAPWLTDPERINLWDYIIVAKLDRLSRSMLDFQKLLEWCKEHGKTIVSISEGFDLSTPYGRMAANMLMMFAEFERERMGERRSERAQADKARGWFGGGRTKYGFRAVKVADHYEVEIDEAEKAIAYRMADMRLAGKSAARIAQTLTAEGVPTKLGDVKKGPKAGQPRKWAGGTILDILADPDGILDTETWTKLQPLIRDAARPKVNRYSETMLGEVAECARCQAPMWAHNTRRGDTAWNYYRCSNHGECKAKMIRAEDLDAIVDADFTETYGDVEERVRVLVPGGDVQRQLKEIDRQVDALNARRAQRAITLAEFRKTLDILLAEQERLEGLPQEPDRYEEVPTGRTYGQMWAALDDEGKRAFLLGHGVKVIAQAGAKRGDEPETFTDWGFTSGRGLAVNIGLTSSSAVNE